MDFIKLFVVGILVSATAWVVLNGLGVAFGEWFFLILLAPFAIDYVIKRTNK